MHGTLLRPVAALVAGFGLAVGMLGAAAVPAQAATFSVSVTASDASLQACEGLNLTGKVSPAPSSRTIYVQQRLTGATAWTTVAKASTTSAGNYRLTVVPTTAGERQYRVYKPKSSARKAGYSRKLLVAVTPPDGSAVACGASSALSGGAEVTVTAEGAGAATAVTFRPLVQGDWLASGVSELPAIPATFRATGDDTLAVVVPPWLGGDALITVSTPSGDTEATFTYKRTWRSASTTDSAVLAELNKRRARTQVCNGTKMPKVPALAWNGELADLALSHSRDLAARQGGVYDGLTHATYGLKGMAQRFYAAKWTGSFGEVLALSPKAYAPAQIVDQWMASTTGHCESVMNRKWTKAGVGLAVGVWQTKYGPQESTFSNVDFS